MTVQPTEQCVQTFLRIVAPEVAMDPAASALRTVASGSVPIAARPPTVRPERRRKVRRSRRPCIWPANASASVPRRAWRSVLLISMCVPPSARIPVHAIERLHVIGLLVTGLPFFIVVLGVGLGRGGEWGRGGHGDSGAGAKHAKEVTTGDPWFILHFVLFFHRIPSLDFVGAPFHDGSANASVSTSINTRPSVPIRR